METRSIHTGTYGIIPAEGGMFVVKALNDEKLKAMTLTHVPLGVTLILPVGYRPEFSNSNTLNRDLKVQSAAAPTQTMMGKNSYEDLHVSILNMGVDHAIKRGDVIAYLYIQEVTKLPPAENLGQISVVGDIRTVPSNVVSYLMTLYNADFNGMIKMYFTESTSPDNLEKYKTAGANLGCQQLYDAASAAVKDTINRDFQNKKKFSMQPRVVNTTVAPIESHVRPKKITGKSVKTVQKVDSDLDESDDEPIAPVTPAKTVAKVPDFADLMSSDDEDGKPVPKLASASIAPVSASVEEFSDEDNVDEVAKPAPIATIAIGATAPIADESDSEDEPPKPVAKKAVKKPSGDAGKSARAVKPAPVTPESDSEDEPPKKPASATSKIAKPTKPVAESDDETPIAATKPAKPAPVTADPNTSDDEPRAVAKPMPSKTAKPVSKVAKPKPKPAPVDSDSEPEPTPKKPSSNAGKSTKPAPKYVADDDSSEEDVVQTPAALAAIARAKAAAASKAEKIAADKAAELAAAAAEFNSSDNDLAAVDANSSSDDDSDDSEGPGTRKPVAKPAAARAIVPPRSKGPSGAFVRKN